MILRGQILSSSDSVGSVGAFANSYSDNGLIGFAATTNGADVESTFVTLANALQAGNITDDEVSRAKAVLTGAAAQAGSSQAGRTANYAAVSSAGYASPDAIAVSDNKMAATNVFSDEYMIYECCTLQLFFECYSMHAHTFQSC